MFGFERRFLSENEIVYKHTATRDVFTFLSEDFASDHKAVEFQPITHGDLWRFLPEPLKVCSSISLVFSSTVCDIDGPCALRTIASEEPRCDHHTLLDGVLRGTSFDVSIVSYNMREREPICRMR